MPHPSHHRIIIELTSARVVDDVGDHAFENQAAVIILILHGVSISGRSSSSSLGRG